MDQRTSQILGLRLMDGFWLRTIKISTWWTEVNNWTAGRMDRPSRITDQGYLSQMDGGGWRTKVDRPPHGRTRQTIENI